MYYLIYKAKQDKRNINHINYEIYYIGGKCMEKIEPKVLMNN